MITKKNKSDMIHSSLLNDNMAQDWEKSWSKETSMLRIFLLIWMSFSSAAGAGLEVGDQAPPFRLPGSDGNEYSLQQFLGKTPVVIAWYPKAFTGG